MSNRAEIQRLLDTMPPDWKRQWAGARKQLRALDYDAAAQPDVDDAMQALYLTAGGNESGDPIKGPIPVPAAVRDEAMRALRMAHKHNYGAWNFIGVARAIQLAVVPSIGQKSVDRMRAFFTRHQKDAQAPRFGDEKKPSRGYLAHLVWGGDPAKGWVMGIEKRAKRNPSDLRETHIKSMERKYADRPEPRSHFRRPRRAPDDIRTHFHLHTGGYTSEVPTVGERGWKLAQNDVGELYLRDAYFEFDPTGHRKYLESFSYDPKTGKDMGYRGVHAYILGRPQDPQEARQYSDWRPARYSDGRQFPPCFVDMATGNCLPNDRSVDVWLESVPNTDKKVRYRGGRAPKRGPKMMYRFNDSAKAGLMDMEKRAKRNGHARPNKATPQTETPAFQRWFGASKVVTPSGRPKKVYHGTERAGFSAFAESRAHFFSDKAKVAATYAKDEDVSADPKAHTLRSIRAGVKKPGLYAVYLRMERPLVVDAKGKEYHEIPDSGVPLDPAAVSRVLGRPHPKGFDWSTDLVTFAASRLGYDGVIFKRLRDEVGGDWYEDLPPSTVYAVFDPKNIKSANFNEGTFDPNDPDIRHNPRRRRR